MPRIVSGKVHAAQQLVARGAAGCGGSGGRHIGAGRLLHQRKRRVAWRGQRHGILRKLLSFDTVGSGSPGRCGRREDIEPPGQVGKTARTCVVARV